MGMTVRAHLVYAITFNDDEAAEDVAERIKDDWKTMVLKQRGINNPYENSPDDAAWLLWKTKHQAELDAWCTAKTAIATEFGMDVGYTGHVDLPVPYLYITSTETMVYSGGAAEITSLAVDPTWGDHLRRFAEMLGVDLETTIGPAWFLLSSYG